MYDTSDRNDEARSGHSAGHPADHRDYQHDGTEPRRRRRRFLRVALISLGSLLGLVIAAVGGGYAYLNHMVSSIPRIHVANLVATASPRQTFLITADRWGGTRTQSEGVAPLENGDLVMLLHINAGGTVGGLVTISADASVNVPGHGVEPLWDALIAGGPDLLVKTITQVTGIPVNHYARIDLDHMSTLIDAVGGIDVHMPAASAGSGHNFVNGINHLNGATVTYYALAPGINEQGLLLRQENVVRTLLGKIADDHLITHPVTMVRVLGALKSMLTVDSSLTNKDVVALSTRLGRHDANAVVYVTAPTLSVPGELVLDTALADQLWTAVQHDALPAFAKRYPATVTPNA